MRPQQHVAQKHEAKAHETDADAREAKPPNQLKQTVALRRYLRRLSPMMVRCGPAHRFLAPRSIPLGQGLHIIPIMTEALDALRMRFPDAEDADHSERADEL